MKKIKRIEITKFTFNHKTKRSYLFYKGNRGINKKRIYEKRFLCDGDKYYLQNGERVFLTASELNMFHSSKMKRIEITKFTFNHKAKRSYLFGRGDGIVMKRRIYEESFLSKGDKYYIQNGQEIWLTTSELYKFHKYNLETNEEIRLRNVVNSKKKPSQNTYKSKEDVLVAYHREVFGHGAQNVKEKQNLRDKIIESSYSELEDDEIEQLLKYIKIFNENDFKEHWEVNNIITKKNEWDSFKRLRSYNNHGNNKIVKGILPVYFAIVCAVLRVTADEGDPLLDAKRY